MATPRSKERFWLEISEIQCDEDHMEQKVLYAADLVIGQRRVCNDVLFMVGDNLVFHRSCLL